MSDDDFDLDNFDADDLLQSKEEGKVATAHAEEDEGDSDEEERQRKEKAAKEAIVATKAKPAKKVLMTAAEERLAKIEEQNNVDKQAKLAGAADLTSGMKNEI